MSLVKRDSKNATTINGTVRIAPSTSKPMNISVVIALQHTPLDLPTFSLLDMGNIFEACTGLDND
jgi:hypothetical protein